MKKHEFIKETPVVIYDKDGFPSMMLKLENVAPTTDQADRIFFVKGQEYDSIYLSRFLNSVIDGHAVSLPFMDPKVNITMDQAIAKIKAKGEKWHLLTNVEWRYIIDTMAEGTHGNTNFGTYHGDASEVGICVSNSSGRTLTGSGPASWFHNGDKESGIADAIGNIWKIIAGLRLRGGALEYMKDNDAAAPDADLSETSEEFVRVMIDDKPVKIGTSKEGLTITTGEVEGWEVVERREVVIDIKEVPDILKDLGIITDNMKDSSEWFAADADLDEAIALGGGSWNSTSSAGPSALGLDNPRSDSNAGLGFFSALLGEPVRR